MRVLIVCDHSMTFVAGVQSAIRRQVRALAEAGHQVVLVAPSATTLDFDANVTTVEPPKPFVRVPKVGFPIYLTNDRLIEFFDSLLQEHKIDSVLSHSEGGLAVSAAKAARARKMRVGHVVHSFFITVDSKLPLPRRFLAWLYKRLMRIEFPNQNLNPRDLDNFLLNYVLAFAKFSDVVISPSKHQAEALERAGVDHVEVISNVTDTVRQKKPLPAFDQIRILWAGRFSPEKRLDVALDAFAQARATLAELGRSPQSLQLGVAGGPAREDESITWHGKVNPERMRELIDASHAILLTSYNFDNQPMVVLEAFAHARAAVLSDPTLANEFGAGAILAEGIDSTGLAKTLVDLVLHPEKIEEAAKQAERRAAEASGTEHARRIVTALGKSS